MYFAKDELIELNNNKKYLVLDTAILDNNIYYKIQEVNKEEKEIINEPIFITTYNKDGKIYINEDLNNEELEKIKTLFEG